MGGRIPQQFIDDLLGRVDIIDVIDARVPLKKKGKDYMACCPFHNEKTPSFSVSQDKQFYYCFGCGASGSALGFLMDYEHMDFVEAIHALASLAGVDVPTEDGPVERGPDLSPLFDVLAKADDFYQQQLREHPHAGRAVDYLKKRGLSGAVARDFGIGFAPPGWDNLLKKLGDSDAGKKALLDAGMVIQKDEERLYDRFRDRIMFPIRDRRGRVIAFGGRVLDGDGQGAKYLNSPETAVFHKGKELYGLYEARKAVRDLERLLVVEGYMDVVALAQYDIRYAVATLGTATTTVTAPAARPPGGHWKMPCRL
jgi:DNA primase